MYYIYGKGRKLKNKNIWSIILLEPSKCRACNTRIDSVYLTPVLGGILTGGKCNYCKVSFGYTFVLIEFLFGLFFVITLYQTKNILYSIVFIFLLGHILISMFTDLNKYILDYENLVFILSLGFLLEYILNGKLPDGNNLKTGLGFFIVFFLIYFFYPKGMGLGDIFFISAYASILSHPLWIFFLNTSYVLALIFSFFHSKKAGKISKTKIPMGFYYGIGIILTLFFKIFFTLELQSDI